MIPHFQITQGQDEWHAIRYGKIGGTRSKGLHVKSDTLFYEVLSELQEPYVADFDEYISPAMLRGMELEPDARRELSEYTEIDFLECGWLQCEENELLGISPDGINKELTVACEIKCPESKRHTETIHTNKTPLDNMHQVLHYFTINPLLEHCYFCSYRPESIKRIFVERFHLFSQIDIGKTKKIKVNEDRGKGLKEYIETVSDIRTIAEWKQESLKEAVILQIQLNQAILNLQF